jgi:hypothetical protein
MNRGIDLLEGEHNRYALKCKILSFELRFLITRLVSSNFSVYFSFIVRNRNCFLFVSTCVHICSFLLGSVVAYHFVFCVYCFVCPRSVFLWPVSLYCPFMIAPSVFSNIFIIRFPRSGSRTNQH